ncbi:MAG: efflux RND transporter periplasmic adaptor subunit [Rhizobiaceae bacterium]|nr:efflux RND transporter periplasmic adaptor subunit [Rhizobiaceae bacterium]
MTSRPIVRGRFLTALLSVALLGAAPGVSSAAGETDMVVKQAPPAIRVVTAERRELEEVLAVNGTIVARAEAAVGTDLGGLTVLALNADEGDVVKRGDVLAVLDRSMLDTQLAQINASRAQAEANIAQMRAQIGDASVGVRQAQETLERAEALRKKGFAPEAQKDNAVNALDSARAKLDSAEKALAASEAQLAVIDAQKQNVLVQISKTDLRAPADGLVLARNATLGGVVMAGGAPLFRIAIDGDFELEANVPETELPRLSSGMVAKVTIPGLDAPVSGTIRRISPEVNQASRLGSIRIALGRTHAARAGNFARGEIILMHRAGLAVPASAVMYTGTDAYLQRVEDGRVESRQVSLGVRSGGLVEIRSGLAEGDEVVSRAGTFVADGDLVTPVRIEATGAVSK